MRFETSQHMKLGQHMKLAPRMIQSMEILQLPTLALEERIEQELESNVTLETVEPGESADPLDLESQHETDDRRESERPLDIDESGASDFERLDSMEESYGEAFENEYSAAGLQRTPETYEPGTYSRSRMAGERDGKMDAMANTAARSAGFSEQLLDQWRFADVEKPHRALGELLIGFIDEDGYLRTDLAAIADRAPAGKKAEPAQLEEALGLLQCTLEPVGIGARDTRECLMLQLDALEREWSRSPAPPADDVLILPVVRRLIAEHLDDLVQNRLPRIAQKTGLALEEIKKAVHWMQRLSVSPGRALVDESPPAIIPDASIEYDDEQDRYVARLETGRLPSLRINANYAQLARDRSAPKETREFVKTNLLNAQWLIDAINQRAGTLQRVLSVVAEAQRDFFDQGPQALRPLPMTQVADQLGVHVATVSRAVAGKHVQTPRGVFPLRRFFSGGLQTDAGEDVSWDAIKAALSEIIDAEDKTSPLSDEALVDELKKKGIEIARRTVAKYRTQLDIPSARMRKQF